VGELTPQASRGDGDPLDICVISERPVDHADVIMDTRVIGGLQMLDDDEADDKIIAVLENDTMWSEVADLDGLPGIMVERLIHYFNTYKIAPGEEAPKGRILKSYDRTHAEQVIRASLQDYEDMFGG
jgi:inorganic pyrophosphatase